MTNSSEIALPLRPPHSLLAKARLDTGRAYSSVRNDYRSWHDHVCGEGAWSWGHG